MKLHFWVITLLLVCIGGVLNGDVVYVDRSLDEIKNNPKLLDPAQYKVHFGHGVPNSSSRKTGSAYYMNGYYTAAAARYTANLKSDPTNKNTLYNLAGCYGVLNQPDLASRYLILAFDNGFTNLRHVMTNRKFKKVKNSPVFKATVDSLLTVKANPDKKKKQQPLTNSEVTW